MSPTTDERIVSARRYPKDSSVAPEPEQPAQACDGRQDGRTDGEPSKKRHHRDAHHDLTWLGSNGEVGFDTAMAHAGEDVRNVLGDPFCR